MRWLVLLVAMPPAPSRNRVRVWRRLKRIGAFSLKGAAWILPEREDTTELFQWLLQEIESLKGDAALLHVDRVEPMDDQQVGALLSQERAAEYETIRRTCEAALAQLRRGAQASGDTLRRLKTKLTVAKRDLDRVARIAGMRCLRGEPEAEGEGAGPEPREG